MWCCPRCGELQALVGGHLLTTAWAEVMEACSERPCSAFDILPVMFKRPLDMHQTTFAMGEAVAHLHALWFAGKLARTRDAQGVYRFGIVGASA